jgi:hypothetical protein
MLTHVPGPWSPLFGRLTLAAIPYNNPIIIFAFAFSAVAALLIVAPVLYYKKIPYLFREWLTTVDHKKIGVMYIILGLVMMFRGFVDGMMIRTQQVMADGPHSARLSGSRPRLPAAGSFRPDLQLPRHADDHFRRHAHPHGPRQYHRTAANRRAGHGLSHG